MHFLQKRSTVKNLSDIILFKLFKFMLFNACRIVTRAFCANIFAPINCARQLSHRESVVLYHWIVAEIQNEKTQHMRYFVSTLRSNGSAKQNSSSLTLCVCSLVVKPTRHNLVFSFMSAHTHFTKTLQKSKAPRLTKV